MELNEKRHRAGARILHWGMAVLILGMIPAGFVMIQQGLPRGLQNTLFILHKNIGVVLLVLAALRLVYRAMRPPRLAPLDLDPLQEKAAHVTHLALYALLVIMPLSGYIRVRAGGFPIETLDALGVPALVPRSDALAEVAKAVHFYGAYALVGLLALHVWAAAFHGLVRRDGVFGRMWPPLGRGA